MAGTITYTPALTCVNGEFKDEHRPGSVSITQTGQGKSDLTQAMSTVEATVVVTGVTTYGVAVFENLSETDGEDIIVGPDSTGLVDFLVIEPGESWPLRLKPGVTIKGKSATGTPKLRTRVFED